MEVDLPELSNRYNSSLFTNEANQFRTLHIRIAAGRQRKSWWYGYPNIVKFITGKSGWQGGIVKPLFILPLNVNGANPSLPPNIPRINSDAFRDLGLELEHIRSLAETLGLFADDYNNFNLTVLTNKLREFFPDFQILDLPNSISDLPFNSQTMIYNKGIILAADASNFNQGLEKELSEIKNADQDIIRKSSLAPFFPKIKSDGKTQVPAKDFDLSEAIELNEQQKETVLSAFKNKITVVTGPPGTGKSQVVASIVINAAQNGQRVLVASKNHKAVDVVEERLNQFAARPFIIRLGRKGTDDRNIQQEFLLYLNGLVGSAPDNMINQKFKNVQSELNNLYSKTHSLQTQIEEYRNYRNNLLHYSKLWEEANNRLGSKANIIFDKCRNMNLSFFDKILLKFSKDWKNIFKYIGLLKRVYDEVDLETISLKLSSYELQIRKKSKDEFVLWLSDQPSRLDQYKREIVGKYVSVLEQIVSADNEQTPKKVWAQLLGARDKLMQSLAGFLPAWCVTNLSARGQLPLLTDFFDIVIIDEASQCDIVSALPLLYRAKRAVIIGDPNQLTHISTLNTGRSLALMHNHNITDPDFLIFEATKNSLYRLASTLIGDGKIIMLNEHFRSHEDIITYSNNTWYSGNLDIGTDYKKLNPLPDESTDTIEWRDIIGNIQQVDGSVAFINEEVNEVVREVIKLVNAPNVSYSIGVVTPFRLQANKIRQALVNQIPAELWDKTDLLIDTAVKFQGDERDIMIFSPVVTTNMPRGIRYYHESEYNLLNVAITRARAKLIIVGNLQACLNCGISYIQNFARYVSNLKNKDIKSDIAAGGTFESPYEKILYKALINRKIKTIPQYQFDQYRLDLAYINGKKQIDIEVDGVTYNTEWTGERLKQDIIRNHKLQKKGWTVLRFWSYEIRDNIDYCIDRIIKEVNK
jgi:very-short-patch-repair endonuclease/energy-coupling factor transporter ATP-binding protein EcfA2